MNTIPIFGWLISFVAHVSLAIPFWIIWAQFNIGTKFFYFLPEVFQSISFWETVGFFMTATILNQTVVPKFCKVSQTNSQES